MAPLIDGILRFLERFGHLSDSGNDFSAVPWRERPGLVLTMLANYHAPAARTNQKLYFEELPLPTLRRLLLGPVYRRARRYRWYREAVSSLYTYGYGLFREYFLALADRLVQRGILRTREDIFYLHFSEVREAVEGAQPGDHYARLVSQRQAEIERMRDAPLPETIYGDVAPPLEKRTGSHLRGIPASRGTYTGPVKVLRGIQDLAKAQAGDVLVIPYSDVGWTPLFAKAGAVVAESGGILSHSSIVAREYGIPAVVSVPGACQLADGTMVTVDGTSGEVMVHEAAHQTL